MRDPRTLRETQFILLLSFILVLRDRRLAVVFRLFLVLRFLGVIIFVCCRVVRCAAGDGGDRRSGGVLEFDVVRREEALVSRGVKACPPSLKGDVSNNYE
jgi:hypothetical protein